MTREETKNQTRIKILMKTTELLAKNGFVKVSSKEIAKASGLSQGTIFLHFQTKDNLLSTLLISDINTLIKRIDERCTSKMSTDEFLKEFLDALTEHELLLSRTYKDFSYLSEDIKKLIEHLETMVKNKFFENYRNAATSKMSIVDTFIAIDAFYSQVVKYLTEKEIFTQTNSVIRQSRGKLIKLHRILFRD